MYKRIPGQTRPTAVHEPDTRTYEICACDEAAILLEALEQAWAELPLGARFADEIIRKALDRHHESVLEQIEREGL